MVAPDVIIFVDAIAEAKVVTTWPLVIGMETEPNEKIGWPHASTVPSLSTAVTVHPGAIERSPRISSTPTMSPGFKFASSGLGSAFPPATMLMPQPEICLLNCAMVSGYRPAEISGVSMGIKNCPAPAPVRLENSCGNATRDAGGKDPVFTVEGEFRVVSTCFGFAASRSTS